MSFLCNSVFDSTSTAFAVCQDYTPYYLLGAAAIATMHGVKVIANRWRTGTHSDSKLRSNFGILGKISGALSDIGNKKTEINREIHQLNSKKQGLEAERDKLEEQARKLERAFGVINSSTSDKDERKATEEIAPLLCPIGVSKHPPRPIGSGVKELVHPTLLQ